MNTQSPMTSSSHFRPLVLMALAVALLAGCTSSPRTPAPVEDRTSMGRASTHTATPAAEVPKPLPGSENAGKPGYYTVQRGDTLTRIGLDNGQGWRDLARWNNLANPDVIEVGQVLRVSPPGGAVETSGVVVRPVPASGSASSVSTPDTATSKEPAKDSANKPNASAQAMQFIWPSQGKLISKFDANNKGIEIAGKKGDPILAAEAGKVAYVGESLRGYGKLILIKHNGYLTAYGHNDKFNVKEDQLVTKGQKIAEMGNTDADAYKLKFEIRDTAGKALNPVTLLPQR
jgi:lipoprotein NlpD